MKKYLALLLFLPLFSLAETVTVKISGMHCSGCNDLVSEALEQVPGVTSAQADYKTKTATLEVKDAKALKLKDINDSLAKIGERYAATEIVKTPPKKM